MNYLACLSRCFGLAAGNVKVSQFEQALNEIQLDTSTMGLSVANYSVFNTENIFLFFQVAM